MSRRNMKPHGVAPLIRELVTDEEYAELLRRMVQVLPNGPLLGYPQVFEEPCKN